jgi:hypothetical protein
VVYNGRENHGEKAGGGNAGYPYRNIGSLDAGIEEHPVDCQKNTAKRNFPDMGTFKALQPARDKHEQGHAHYAHHHPVTDKRKTRKADNPAEKSGCPGKKYGKMQEHQSFISFAHLSFFLQRKE